MNRKEERIGVVQGFFTYILWGSLPIYWKLLSGMDSFLVISYRMLMSFLFIFVVCFILYKKEEIFAPLKRKGVMLMAAACGIFITINWGTYIWAVGQGHIVECSMGYYINPLLSMLAGVIFFREKLDKLKILAASLAGIGVLIMIFRYGHFPWIAITLALTFAFYGIFKKKLQLSACFSLLYETAVILPFAIMFIIFMESRGVGFIGNATAMEYVLMALAGAITAIPLLLFASCMNKIKMTTMGFLQFVSPTISLILGIFLYGEDFSAKEGVTFFFIWVGIVVFIISTFLDSKKANMIIQ